MPAPEISRTTETRRAEVDTRARLVEMIEALDELGVPWEARTHDTPAPFGAPGDIDRSYIVDAPS